MGEELLCRKEQAERQRQQEEEEEAPDHDDELLRRLSMQLLENQKAIAEFERRDQIFIQQLQIRKEQQQRRLQNQEGHGSNEDDDCQYVEEGRSQVIFKGNGILYNKKKTALEDPNRPTSNPTVSAQQLLDDVAPQVPNFGTEQDKDHCPFHLKTGACRFGPRCSRVHFYPDKSCTLLMKNLYNGPGLAWEQDEGLEVCRNSSSHLRGNVYVQYKSLDSAMVANQSINRRYFAGKQVTCEFINVTKWKVAICGEFMKSKLKTCSRGTACNFIHCFRNPGGDYEWADWDKPPPGYWIRKVDALFGYTDETAYERQVEDGNFVPLWDTDRYHSKRFHSKDYAESSNRNSRTHYQEENAHDTHRSARSRKQSRKDRNLRDFHHDKYDGEETSGMDHPGRIDKFCASDPDKYWSDRDADANWYDDNTRRRLRCPEGKRKSRDNEDDHKKGRHRDYYSRKRSREQVDDHKDSKISVEHSISSQEQSRQSSKRPSEEVDDHKESKISDDDAGGMT